ncbi:phosphoribosyl-AMP cyclohydrolase [Flavobacterium litorale]|uniref:Phosphoribosyl-AMP cyclohydrolase n=1 Tax=Flavobacterium litorale TaxID=2856519 RepID=A0ABX8V530_9FLAO|nr:phosphoribosyl-AMP cyclohydrolase [Flavobacterium litorale]QYJ67936.1 phosphoribosyl-AMP cyclohydrolase [Flavobacterium litorale]
MKKSLNYLFLAVAAMVFVACNQNQNSGSETASEKKSTSVSKDADHNPLLYSDECITEREVIEAQKQWGNGIVRIGKIYTDEGDYSKEAADFIQEMYGYDLSSVLFKPTLASDDQFRLSFDAALSYFVGGNDAYPEDKGFAIKPYTKVTFDNSGIINNSCRMAIAMGNYFFTATDGSETKVEYTFAYVKDKTGKLRIVAHQSSLPYKSSK